MRLLILLIFLWQTPGFAAGPSDLTRPVSVHYNRVQLKTALKDLERRYDLRFSYSSDHIPVDQRVSVHRENTPLGVVLDDLFAETRVVYALIGKQIVLKIDPNKPVRDPWAPVPQETGYRSPEVQILPIGSIELSPIEKPLDDSAVKNQSVVLRPEDQTAIERWSASDLLDLMNTGMPQGKRFFQASVFPPFGTNGWESSRLVNLYSVNLLVGLSGGVEGSEWSLLLNTTEGDVRGMQVSGLANVAEGGLSGTQLSGGLNVAMGTANGRQLAGLVNVAGQMTGTQAALLVNITREEFRGRQIGLVNMADTVSGVSFGLLNLVRRGYNRVEIGAGEALWANLSLKLGPRSFYNVLHSGFRWGDNIDGHIWGLGYGFGTAIRLSRRFTLNLEGVSIHLSKGSQFTRKLNLLNQLRLTLDWRVAGRFSIFAGGTANLMTSRVKDPETGKTGYDIAPNDLYHKVLNNGTDLKGWVGFTGGIRF